MNLKQRPPASNDQPLALAEQALRAGEFPRAEQLCRQLVERDPGNAAAWHFFGNACFGQGKLPEAVAHYQRALQVRPDSAELFHSLGRVRAAQGKREEAIRNYREAIKLQPDHGEALTNLGVLLAEQRELEEAIRHLRRAVACRPDLAKAHLNLGVSLDQLGKRQEAEQCLRQAIKLKPDYGEAHYNLGCVLVAQEKHAESLGSFRDALRCKPDNALAYNNLGLALVELGQQSEAVVLFKQALRLRPKLAEAHNNLGMALAELGQFREAEECFERALQIEPQHSKAHGNLGNVLKDQGRLDEAVANYQIALWLDPESASIHWNRSLAWLQGGNFEQGWPEYEWRWKRKKDRPRKLPVPLWDGASFAGRTLLLHMEQGIGDMIQFIRYAPLVKERGGTVLLECPPRLVHLFSICAGIDRVLPSGTPYPSFDLHAPLMTLPGLFGTTLKTIPAPVPYLSPDAERVHFWGNQLAGRGGLKIGIAWQGNRKHRWDRHRSLRLASLAPLANVPHVQLISLQKRDGTEQIAEVAPSFRVSELPGDWDPLDAALADTAAVMKHLDLVITVDTAIAHLAGALGVPVWVALSAMTDWRWLLGRDDSPWYPTMRLFRQERLGDGAPVMNSMARALEQLRASSGRSLSEQKSCTKYE